MDVERGRTVKGWRPRRLGECMLPTPGSAFCAWWLRSPCVLLHPLLLSVFSSPRCPAATHIASLSGSSSFHHRHMAGVCLSVLGYQVGTGAWT